MKTILVQGRQNWCPEMAVMLDNLYQLTVYPKKREWFVGSGMFIYKYP